MQNGASFLTIKGVLLHQTKRGLLVNKACLVGQLSLPSWKQVLHVFRNTAFFDDK